MTLGVICSMQRSELQLSASKLTKQNINTSAKMSISVQLYNKIGNWRLGSAGGWTDKSILLQNHKVSCHLRHISFLNRLDIERNRAAQYIGFCLFFPFIIKYYVCTCELVSLLILDFFCSLYLLLQ